MIFKLLCENLKTNVVMFKKTLYLVLFLYFVIFLLVCLSQQPPFSFNRR